MPRGVFKRKSLEARFEEKYIPEPNSGCWLWTGAYDRGGYSTLSHLNKPVIGHRVSYELFKGKIPAGQNVCHSCDNRACVNPDHLFLGTQRENVEDMLQKGRQRRGSTHGMAKLTEADVAEIRATKGVTQYALAAQYGVTRSAIADLLKGRSWAHLP